MRSIPTPGLLQAEAVMLCPGLAQRPGMFAQFGRWPPMLRHATAPHSIWPPALQLPSDSRDPQLRNGALPTGLDNVPVPVRAKELAFAPAFGLLHVLLPAGQLRSRCPRRHEVSQ